MDSEPLQVFPKTPEELPGLWAVQPVDQENEEYKVVHIIREFDDQNDTWQGQTLMNPRRNKFWSETLQGKEVLCCFDWFRSQVTGESGYGDKIKFYTSNPNQQ